MLAGRAVYCGRGHSTYICRYVPCRFEIAELERRTKAWKVTNRNWNNERIGNSRNYILTNFLLIWVHFQLICICAYFEAIRANVEQFGWKNLNSFYGLILKVWAPELQIDLKLRVTGNQNRHEKKRAGINGAHPNVSDSPSRIFTVFSVFKLNRIE